MVARAAYILCMVLFVHGGYKGEGRSDGIIRIDERIMFFDPRTTEHNGQLMVGCAVSFFFFSFGA